MNIYLLPLSNGLNYLLASLIQMEHSLRKSIVITMRRVKNNYAIVLLNLFQHSVGEFALMNISLKFLLVGLLENINIGLYALTLRFLFLVGLKENS